MIHGVILTDNTFNNLDITCHRGAGAHKIATHLRQHGYNIEVIDYCLSWSESELLELLSKLISNSTLFLGIGSNLFLDRSRFDDTIRLIKQRYPNLPIVLGGNQTLTRSIPCVDYYVEGYAENAILHLLDYLRGKIDRNDIHWSPLADNLIDALTDYGPVDTNDLTIEYLSTDFLRPEQTLGMETARGCIFKCKFCTYPLIGKSKLDYIRDPNTIVTELKTNYDQWGITNYLINEDTFNDSIEKLETLERAITSLPFKINFTAYGRLDLIAARPHSAELLRNMGLQGIHFGIETFSKEAGRLVGKGFTGQRAKDAILWWKEQMPNVTTNCSMIVGLPGDDSDYHSENQWLQTSGVEYWYWQPLYITKQEKTIHTSEFSKEFDRYGLSIMSDSEVNAEVRKLWRLEYLYKNRQHQYTYRPFIDENFRSKVGYWKDLNNGENYFTALKTSCELNQSVTDQRVSAWTQFDYVSLGYSLNDIKTWISGKSVPPLTEMKSRSDQRINEYKIKKLTYDYTEFYRHRTQPIKRIVPIVKF